MRWAPLLVLASLVRCEDGLYDVTLVTQATTDKFWLLPELCDRWRGPLSLALWLTADEGARGGARDLEDAAAAAAKTCASSGGLAIEARVAAYDGEAYPVNALRNAALARVNTSHHLVSDADFLPSRGLRDAARAERRWLAYERMALVVPAFQRRGGNCKTVDACRARLAPLSESVPGRHGQLVRCLSEESCIVFQGDNSPTSHSTTDSGAWLLEATVRPLRCFKSNRYEPYVIVRTSPAITPRYDERFTGYGKNKIQHVSHLRRIGFAFSVLPRQFLVHVPHPKSTAKKSWLSDERTHKAVDTLYATFIRELDASAGTADIRVHLCSMLDGSMLKKGKRRKDGSDTSLNWG